MLVGSRLATRMIDFVALLVLARLLAPADFGIIAIALTLVQMLEAVFDVPIAQVFIRSSVIEPEMLDTAFTLGVLRSIILVILLCSAAVPFGMVYQDSRLVALVSFLSLAPAFRGLISPAMAIFARELDFRRDVIIEILGKILGFGAAVGGATALGSYWAIAFATVLTPVAMAITSYILAPYRPRFSLRHWNLYFGFLGWFTVSQFIAAINWKLSRLVLGAYESKDTLGAFSMASDLCVIPEQALIGPTIRPLASGFAKLQFDVDRLGSAYLRSSSMLVSIGLPPLLVMATLAEPAVRMALGSKWQAAPPIVTWLALLAGLALITASFNALCMALGHTRRIFLTNLADLSVRLPMTVSLTMAFGLEGTVAAQFVATGVYTLLANQSIAKIAHVSMRRQWTSHWRSFTAGIVMVSLLFWLRSITDDQSGIRLFVSMAALSLIACGAYLVTLMTLWRLTGRPDGFESMVINVIYQMRSRLRRPSPAL